MSVQLRDEAGAARSLAYLLMGGSAFVLLTGVILPEIPSIGGILTFAGLTVCLAAGGIICRWRTAWVPRAVLLIAPFLGTGLICTLNVATRDASTGAQLFYLWPILYAANFLGRLVNVATVTLVSGANAGVVFPVLGAQRGFQDWASLTVAMALTSIVVGSLRNRNEKLREVLESQAFADPLTGVANRRSFDDELARAVAWAHQTGAPIALFTLDVDHFKKINDTWGHAVGDQALQAVARALQTIAAGPNDVVGRLGGDEFVVLLRTDGAGARRTADELRALVAAVDTLPCGPPGLSIGVALLPDHAGTAVDLGAASDAALYAAKQGGRGRTAMARPADRHNVDHRPADSQAGAYS